MSFIYPRLISVYRQSEPAAAQTGYGAQPYQEPQTSAGASVWASVPIYTGVACSIQEYRAAQRPIDNLPGSEAITPSYKIFIPKRSLLLGSLLLRDLIQDDIGYRYTVMDTYCNSLGYRIYAEILET